MRPTRRLMRRPTSDLRCFRSVALGLFRLAISGILYHLRTILSTNARLPDRILTVLSLVTVLRGTEAETGAQTLRRMTCKHNRGFSRTNGIHTAREV